MINLVTALAFITSWLWVYLPEESEWVAGMGHAFLHLKAFAIPWMAWLAAFWFSPLRRRTAVGRTMWLVLLACNVLLVANLLVHIVCPCFPPVGNTVEDIMGQLNGPDFYLGMAVNPLKPYAQAGLLICVGLWLVRLIRGIKLERSSGGGAAE
ncbi:MAG: hypothetical protein RLZZ618_2663 [Pseudomonadota bacterium]|jgi:hypothetical protein